MVNLNCQFLEEVLYNELTEYVKLAADAAAAPSDVCHISTFETRNTQDFIIVNIKQK